MIASREEKLVVMNCTPNFPSFLNFDYAMDRRCFFPFVHLCIRWTAIQSMELTEREVVEMQNANTHNDDSDDDKTGMT